MPKPIATLTGNGCHAHVSVWNKTGKINLMEDKKGELGLSKLAYHFIGGLLEHAESLAAITNPVVNSYKRINAPRTTSGATWSPNTVTYSGNNRTHMIRIPDSDRIEVRLADGAANPYLLQAVLIGAGLWGVANKTDPGKRLDIDMYAEGHKVKNAPKLPLNLLDALRAFQNNKIMRGILGAEFADSYLKLKMEEWNSYMQHFSEWERQNALDV
jgi:glutamine synthetase